MSDDFDQENYENAREAGLNMDEAYAWEKARQAASAYASLLEAEGSTGSAEHEEILESFQRVQGWLNRRRLQRGLQRVRAARKKA